MTPSPMRSSAPRGRVAFIYRGYENIGIQSLSAVLKEAGFATRLFFEPELFDDWIVRIPGLIRTFDDSERVIEETAAWKPDLVLFSAVTYDYAWARGVAERLRSGLDTTVAFGGIHATSVPGTVMENGFIDFAVQGEGEGAVVRLAEHVTEGASLEGVPNLWRRRDGETIPPGTLTPLIQDLDTLPFADKELHYNASDHFRIGYTIVSGRGCPNSCTYCHNNLQRKLYPVAGYLRRRSPGNVIAELESARERYGFDFVRFSDDNFCYDVDWLEAFCDLYAERVKVPFWIFIHPSTSSTRIVEALRRAGCAEVQMGIQTLDPDVRRDVIRRGETDGEIVETLRMLGEAGIRCSTDFIINLPGHDEEALVSAIRFFRANRPDRINTFWINYYPGLDITEHAMEKGLFDAPVMGRIDRGEGVHTFFQGGTVYNSRLARLQILFSLLHVLPQGMLDSILDRRLYRHIPFPGFKVTYLVMYVLSYLRPGVRNDLYMRRFRMRYRHYMLRRLKRAVRALRKGGGS